MFLTAIMPLKIIKKKKNYDEKTANIPKQK